MTDNVAKSYLAHFLQGRRDASTVLSHLAYADRENGMKILTEILEARMHELLSSALTDAGTFSPDSSRILHNMIRSQTLAWVQGLPEAARMLMKEKE